MAGKHPGAGERDRACYDYGSWVQNCESQLKDLSQRGPYADTRKPQTLEEAERAHILVTLKETGWVLAGLNDAAKKLVLNRSTLQFRMKKLGIERP